MGKQVLLAALLLGGCGAKTETASTAPPVGSTPRPVAAPVAPPDAGPAAAPDKEMMAKRQIPDDAPADAYVAYAMGTGTPDEFCASSTKVRCGKYEEDMKVALAKPWTAAELHLLVEDPQRESDYLDVFLQVDGAWHDWRIASWMPEGGVTKIDVKSITVKDVIAGGQPELLVEWSHSETSDRRAQTQDKVLVCGFGKSQQPSCIDFDVAGSDDFPDADTKYRYKLSWKVDKKGRLIRKAVGRWPKQLSKSDYETPRPLYFL